MSEFVIAPPRVTDFVVANADGTIHNVCSSTMPWSEVQEIWPVEPGQSLVELPSKLTLSAGSYRVVDGEVVERDDIPAVVNQYEFTADGQDECIVGNLPVPCTVSLSGVVKVPPTVVEEGIIFITSTLPGKIKISITASTQYKSREIIVNAV